MFSRIWRSILHGVLMAYPSHWYGDPADAIDRIRAEKKAEEKAKEKKEIIRKSKKKRRIKQIMKGKL